MLHTSLSGSFPLKMLLPKSKAINLEVQAKSFGMEPVKELLDTVKDCRFYISPICSGKLPSLCPSLYTLHYIVTITQEEGPT